MAKWLGIVSMGVFLSAIIVAWMLIPVPVAPASALDLQMQVRVGERCVCVTNSVLIRAPTGS
jgi:hypothetical protein